MNETTHAARKMLKEIISQNNNIITIIQYVTTINTISHYFIIDDDKKFNRYSIIDTIVSDLEVVINYHQINNNTIMIVTKAK